MQTFLPYDSFQKSAEALDHYNAGRYSRLWKQVVEAKQLICALRCDNLPQDWIDSKDYQTQRVLNHPACQMWVGYEESLKSYYNTFLKHCKEIKNINTKLSYLPIDEYVIQIISKWRYPWWLGNEDFHRAMRAKLIEKSPEHYLPIFGEQDKDFNDSRYLWPVNETKTFKMI